MGEWPEVSLSELVDVAVGGLWGSELPTDKEDTPVRVIRGVDAHKMSQREPVELPVRWVTSKQLKGRTLSVGDVVLEGSGACGRSYVIRESDITKNAIPLSFSNFSRRLVPNAKVDPAYLGYRLKQAYESNEIASYVTGTAMPNLDVRSALAGIAIHLPPLPEQRKIASILSALDDKIELNRRMNATLEAMARALFHSWFVDFDPVRAKSEGLQPVGMDAETAALFPDSFEDSPLGPIPTGWEVGTFGEIAQNSESRVKASAITPSTHYVALDDMPHRRISLDQWGNADTVASATTPFKRGDILFGKLRPYFHKVVVTPISGVCSTEILAISPTRDEWFGLVLGHAMSDALVSHASRVSNGTKMPRCKWADLNNYRIAIPPKHIAKIAAERILEMTLTIQINTHSARTAAKVRDALLPKLLSGELRVGEVAV